MPCRLLHLTVAGLVAHRWRNGRLTEESRFDTTPAGLAAFAAYLRDHADGCYRLLADLAGETLCHETIPLLRGRDRQAMIRRRLDQAFPATSLVATRSLGRTRRERREERLLLAALTDPATVAPWLAAIADAEVVFAGVFSPPHLATVLLPQLALARGVCLLLSVHGAGLRQTVFEDGEPRLTRLTPLDDPCPAEIAAAAVTESVRLRQYLAGQRRLLPGTALPVRLLAPAAWHDELARAAADSDGLAFGIVDLADRSGVPPPPDGRADALFLDLLATSPPALQFAGPSTLRRFRQREQALTLRRLAAGALLSGIVFAAAGEADTGRLGREIAGIATERGAIAARLADLRTAAVPPGAAGSRPADEELPRIAAHYRQLLRREGGPAGFYRAVGRGLDTAPALALTALDWRIDDAGTEIGTVEGRTEAGDEAGFAAFVAAIENDRRFRVAVRQPPSVNPAFAITVERKPMP